MQRLNVSIENPSRQTERGQALVEYLLVLIVTVGIILGALYQFNDAFRQYARNYFGNYLACLLETGELPAMGLEEGVSSVCADQLKKFNLADGKPLESAGSTSSNSGENESTRRPASPPVSRTASEPSASGRASSGSAALDGMLRQRGRAPVTSVTNNGGSAGGGSAGSQFEATPTGVRFAGQGEGSGTGDYTSIDGRTRVGSVDEDDEKTGQATKKAVGQASGETLKARVSKVENRPRQPANMDEGEPFTFGDFLRWLLIAAIVIALIVFLGGQVLQISKSWEKN